MRVRDGGIEIEGGRERERERERELVPEWASLSERLEREKRRGGTYILGWTHQDLVYTHHCVIYAQWTWIHMFAHHEVFSRVRMHTHAHTWAHAHMCPHTYPPPPPPPTHTKAHKHGHTSVCTCTHTRPIPNNFTIFVRCPLSGTLRQRKIRDKHSQSVIKTHKKSLLWSD